MLNTVFSTIDSIEEHVTGADLVIGGVLLPGAAAPKLITRKMVEQMKRGSVLVDVAIDQGGCSETSHATTHSDPTYVVDGVVHYCVANMPGGVARTSTFALNNATIPFTKLLADLGPEEAMKRNAHLVVEIGVQQERAVTELLATGGLAITATRHDLSGIPRALGAMRR